jgi:dipeptidyl aminopeptidase/acylaminoacyl peptidase
MIRFGIGFFIAAVLSSMPVAMAAPPPVEAYGKLPGIEEVQISPSGTRYAFVATVGETRRLYVATTDGKALKVAEVGTTKVRGLTWAGDNHVLVELSATVTLGPQFTTWRAELISMAVMNVDTGNVMYVFARHGDKVVNAIFGYYGTAQVDGHWYGWFGGRSCDSDRTGCYGIHNYEDLYRVDLDTGSLVIAARGHDDSDGWLVSPAGEVVARSFYNEKNGGWRILNGKEGDQVLAAGQNDFGGAGTLNFGRSTDALLVHAPTGATDENRGSYSFRELSIGSGATPAGVDTSGMVTPIIDPTTHLWIGETLRNDEREKTFFAPTLQARWKGTKKAFPNNIVHLESWSTDFNKLIVLTEGGDDSGTYWLVDIQKHSADPIGSQYPDVKSADVGPVSMVDYRAADGLALHGVLTLPPGRPAKGLPLVVLPHGGPEARDYPGFDWWAQAYASRGYAVFQPNFRGSSGYGAQFRNAGLGEWGRKMQTDISDGVAELAKKGIVDPKRACIVGGSYGGYAALAGVTVQQGLYRCAVAVAGVADLADMLIAEHKRVAAPTSSGVRYWKAFMGADNSSDSRLAAISPAALAEKADAPILLIHGRDDTVVPIAQSKTMESALKRAGKPVEFVEMKNEDHWLSREATRIEMLKAAVAFVEKYNPSN